MFAAKTFTACFRLENICCKSFVKMIINRSGLFEWLLVLISLSTISLRAEEEVISLKNGCTLIRHPQNSTAAPPTPSKRRSWWEMPLPHLNCSGANLTRLPVKGALEDTKSISLSYNRMLEFHVDDLEPFPNLEKLELKSNQLTRIVASSSSKKLKLNSVNFVSMTHNQLYRIPNDALQSFPNLKTLKMFSNKIDHVYGHDFEHNPKLQFLYLGPNPIKSFEDDWLERLNLQGLNLRGCGLTSLPRQMSNKSSLLHLDMSNNALSKIPARTFDGYSSLYWLELASNQISTLGDDAFKGCAKLKYLDLSDNKLTTLTKDNFGEISKESLEIDLYENPLRCDCSSASFRRWYDDMKERDMSNEIRYKCEQPQRNHGKKSHQITQGDYTCLDGDKQWTANCSSLPLQPTPSNTQQSSSPAPKPTVDNPSACPDACTCYDDKGKLYHGSEDNVPKTGFRYYRMSYPSVVCVKQGLKDIPTSSIRSDVKFMMLSDNQITTLDLAKLRKFTQLTILDLKKNNIRTIKASPSTVLPSVTVLNFRFNNISLLTKTHMRSFPKLRVLAAYYNSLKSIPRDIFFYNKNLQRLYLGPNPVTNFDSLFLQGLDLLTLSLRNMSLTKVPSLISNLTRLSYLDLSDNKITTLKNGTFSTCSSLYRLVLENNHISKIETNAFNGAKRLQTILLSENKLTKLPKGLFSNIADEQITVEFWRNEFVCDCQLKWFKEWIEQMEVQDPTTDVRFQCSQPARFHNKVSHELTPGDFVCSDGADGTSEPASTSQVCKSPAGSIALAVVLTFLFTIACCVVAWRCTFRRHYGERLQCVQ